MVFTNQLVFVTGNENKYREVKQILEPLGFTIVKPEHDVDVPELQGPSEFIAKEKCRRAAEQINGPCITEDTSLKFDALSTEKYDLPGPYIKYFVENIKPQGLHDLLKGYGDPPNMKASAMCLFAYSTGPGTEPHICRGAAEGHIVPPRMRKEDVEAGKKPFGWDPIFQPNDQDPERPEEGGEKPFQTYGEMNTVFKNKISHRAKALTILRAKLEELRNAQ
ncbi:inosine triphosphate pyrophosphatase [Coniophora puteana RWD-64-598 SS2]|uniref:XTP/dITP diphosphatase n=1 Tax=Coniophora puteana (strain RWD-64-598) TaxID=741705 RepID=A0A5M3MBR4_CONPW|nr:inosine triphosphate pyrophosphatase [Coniophora puteana RWD-64-598 SS2]EIW76260.1 inosine triphosphate pyrophosphatase [Coniophora puteana RWD-64-598 SS2]